jgi:Amt family ammonium transporter
MIGLEGFLLRGPGGTPTALLLFVSQLPWITTAVAVLLWSLQGRAGPAARFLGGVLLAVLYSIFGNWVWGGGWLANLGLNLGLGHGFVDYAGSGVVHLAGAASALAAMLAFGVRGYVRESPEQLVLPTLAESVHDSDLRWSARDEPYVPMPALHRPALATTGAWLALVGWLGWAASAPQALLAREALFWPSIVVRLLLAAAGGAMVALAYSWLTTGAGNALMAARAAIGALVAVSAGLPFYPPWAALAVGAGAGLIVPLAQYAVDHGLRLDDPTSALAVHGLSALWGLLAVGFLSDGGAGAGWNRVGEATYLGVEGQGVSGYLVPPGAVSDWPGQFQAQMFGVLSIAVTAFVASWLLFAALRALSRAWQGEYTVRLPARRARPARLSPVRRWLAPLRNMPAIRFVRAPESEPDPAAEAAASGEEALETGQDVRRSLFERVGATLGVAWRRARSGAEAAVGRLRGSGRVEASGGAALDREGER